MKITRIQAYGIHGKCFVVVDTDEEVTGVGECSPMHSPKIGRFVVDVLAHRILGQNPLETDRLWHEMDALFEQPLEFNDGYLTVPDRPGLGLIARPGAFESAECYGTAEAS